MFSFLHEGVFVFLGVKIFGSIIPKGVKVLAFDPENPFRYWVKEKGGINAKWIVVERYTDI